MSEERDPNIVGGLLKGLAVIRAFDTNKPKLAISDIAKETGYDRATCRRLLLTLVHLGYAEHDGKFFRLTPRILRLGHAYLQDASLPGIMQPFLEELSKETEESCSASILHDGQIVYIGRASMRRVMSINLAVGSRLPAYCSSMGRVLLASLDPAAACSILQSADLKALTPKTLTSVEAITVELERVRDQGYAVIDEELELGLRSIAVPIRDSRGSVVAAINIGTHAARISVEGLKEQMLPLLLRVQRDMRRLITDI